MERLPPQPAAISRATAAATQLSEREAAGFLRMIISSLCFE